MSFKVQLIFTSSKPCALLALKISLEIAIKIANKSWTSHGGKKLMNKSKSSKASVVVQGSQDKFLDDSWKSNVKFMSKLKASHEHVTSHEHEEVAENHYE